MGAVAAVVLIVAIVLIWKQIKAMQPNAIYEGSHGEVKSSVAQKLMRMGKKGTPPAGAPSGGQ
jgi:hypothetical protein